MSKHQNKLIRRYTLADILMHWSVAIGFILALVTGYLIFFKGSASLLDNSAGNILRLVHRIGGLIFIVAPVIYFIFSKKRFGFLTAFKWDKSDLGWLKAAPKHYFVGGDGMPPQAKYNTGQKMYYLFVLIFGLLLIVTGFALWFDWFKGPAGLFMVVVHDVSALMVTLFFGVHIYLSAIHPRERVSFNAMVTGYMDEDYAEHHHEIWYNEEIEKEKEKEKEKNKQSQKNHKPTA